MVLIRHHLANDISKGSYGFQKVRTTFAGAYGILTSTAYLHAGILSAHREGRAVHLRNRGEPEKTSILSSVMGITQEVSNLDLDLRQRSDDVSAQTINHRKLVQELYDKRVLHNFLGLKPSPVIVRNDDEKANGIASRKSSPPLATRSAQSTWHKAKLGKESDDEYLPTRPRYAAEDKDEDRYNLRRRQLPRKRRKIGPQNSYTVYTTDDDDEYEPTSAGVDSLDEEAHYASDDDFDLRNVHRGKLEKRRSYWLSKAINIGGSVDDEY